MKRSGFKNKVLTSAQRQIKEETKKWKRDIKLLSWHNSELANSKGRRANGSRSGARGQYYKGEWIPSQWQLECLKILELREKAGEITDLVSQEDVQFKIYNEAGEVLELKINIDFCFFDKSINRRCRWDAKPPKTVHTKHGKKYPQKLHEGWLQRFEILKFCQPDFDYRILEKGKCYEDLDLNYIRK